MALQRCSHYTPVRAAGGQVTQSLTGTGAEAAHSEHVGVTQLGDSLAAPPLLAELQ